MKSMPQRSFRYAAYERGTREAEHPTRRTYTDGIALLHLLDHSAARRRRPFPKTFFRIRD
jgi:hypothetical protein